jgi:hypothetical protein
MGSLKGEMDVWDGVFTMGMVFIGWNIVVRHLREDIPPVLYAYMANFLVLAGSQLSAAYTLIYLV